MSNTYERPWEMGLIHSMSSSEYHGFRGTYSSSQLKDLLEDPEIFYKKYIKVEEDDSGESFSSDALDTGTYFHTAILEPHLIEEECAVFEGVRRGAKWEKFKEENKDKAILTKTSLKKAEILIEAVKQSEIAMWHIEQGTPEVSAFLKVHVCGGDIYAPEYCALLDGAGWMGVEENELPKEGTYVELILKVRADCLGDNYVLDLKSTSGNTKVVKKVQRSISDFNYDLSAALYLDVFTLVSGKPKEDFIWTFASKDIGNCKNWRASRKNILVGRAKYMKAIRNLVHCMSEDWAFAETLDDIEPAYWELEHLKTDDEDIL